MEELRAKLAEIDAIINTEQQRGSMADQGKIATLQQQYQELQAQINQLEVDGITQVVAASIETFVVGDTTFTLEDLVTDKDAADIIRVGLKKLESNLSEKATAWVNDLQSAKAAHAEKEAQIAAEYESKIKQLTAGYESTIADQEVAIKDITGKRDAAMKLADELKAEVDRLNDKVSEMQVENAVGVRAAINVIEIESDADLEAAAQRLKAKKAEKAKADAEAAEAAKIRIYDVQKGDNATTFYTARRADNDELIEIRPYYAINQYVVLDTPEALARFREVIAAEAAQNVVEPVEVPSEPSQSVEVPPMGDSFQEETNGHDVVEGASGEVGTMDGQATEARLAALEARVEALENGNRAVAA